MCQVFRMTQEPRGTAPLYGAAGSNCTPACAVPFPRAHTRWNGVRAHLPGPDGRLMPAWFAPPSPSPPPLPAGTRRRGKTTTPTRLGIALIALSFCVAFATTGVPYLMQRHQEAENAAFLAGLARFGPTPTPLAARAPVAATGTAVSGDGVGVEPPGAMALAISAAPAMQSVQPSAASASSTAHLAPPPLSLIAPPPVAATHATRPAPTHLIIPSIGVDISVVTVDASPTRVDGQAVAIWDVPSDTVGHHASSANPGEGENVVLNGHDDLGSAVFRDLWRVQPGAVITVRAGDVTWRYHVETVRAPQEIGVPLAQRLENARYIEPTGDERLTLISCWPAGTNDHRIIVIARLD